MWVSALKAVAAQLFPTDGTSSLTYSRVHWVSFGVLCVVEGAEPRNHRSDRVLDLLRVAERQSRAPLVLLRLSRKLYRSMDRTRARLSLSCQRPAMKPWRSELLDDGARSCRRVQL